MNKVQECYDTEMETLAIPAMLREIPQPPEKLYLRGHFPQGDIVYLAVVGSRKYSRYGKEACEYLIQGLRGTPVAIVSGLALGIDAIAHRSALDNGLACIAVPGSGLSDDAIYPRSNLRLAHEIIEKGGALISEYEPDMKAAPWTFPQRNRIMVGLSHAVLMIEAGERSGTLITARLTAEYNRELLVVPHSIFNDGAKGNHQFLKLGATPVASPADILDALGLEDHHAPRTFDLTPEERKVYECLGEPRTREHLIEKTGLSAQELGTTLTMLEIQGIVCEEGGTVRRA